LIETLGFPLDAGEVLAPLRCGVFSGELQGDAQSGQRRTKLVGDVALEEALGADQGLAALGHVVEVVNESLELVGGVGRGCGMGLVDTGTEVAAGKLAGCFARGTRGRLKSRTSAKVVTPPTAMATGSCGKAKWSISGAFGISVSPFLVANSGVRSTSRSGRI
jgi:hypothetical protein